MHVGLTAVPWSIATRVLGVSDKQRQPVASVGRICTLLSAITASTQPDGVGINLASLLLQTKAAWMHHAVEKRSYGMPPR